MSTIPNDVDIEMAELAQAGNDIANGVCPVCDECLDPSDPKWKLSETEQASIRSCHGPANGVVDGYHDQCITDPDSHLYDDKETTMPTKTDTDTKADDKTDTKTQAKEKPATVEIVNKTLVNINVLRAAAHIVDVKSNRFGLQNISIMGDWVISTDSYRLVILHRAGDRPNGAQEILDGFHGIDKKLRTFDGSIPVPATLVNKIPKTVKGCNVAVGIDRETHEVTIVAPGGIKMSEKAHDAEPPNYHPLVVTTLNTKIDGLPAFNPAYVADMNTISKTLEAGNARRKYDGSAPMRIEMVHAVDALKPVLFRIGGRQDVGAALYLLAPIKVPAS